jgi:hypothetical protein
MDGAALDIYALDDRAILALYEENTGPPEDRMRAIKRRIVKAHALADHKALRSQDEQA